MARITTNDKHYANIADTIRAESYGEMQNRQYKPAEMPLAITELAAQNWDEGHTAGITEVTYELLPLLEQLYEGGIE